MTPKSKAGKLTVEGGAYHESNPFVVAHKNSGDKLRDELMADGLPYDIVRMIDEAARLSVRLDSLDRLLSGDTDLWLQISEVRGGTLEVRVDNVMGEARQGAGVLRQMITEINRRLRELGTADESDNDPTADL